MMKNVILFITKRKLHILKHCTIKQIYSMITISKNVLEKNSSHQYPFSIYN